MNAKQKTIKLAHYVQPDLMVVGKNRHQWKVLQVTDSTQFNPGQWLEKPQVDDLCDNGGWKVIIVPRAE